MGKELSAFNKIDEIKGIYTAEKGTLRCIAIQLSSGNLCLYSPVQGLSTIAKESLKSLGKVTHLLAPNHYHNKGLEEYSKAFPEAKLCCTQNANPRLKKQTALSFSSLKELEPSLPDTICFVEPLGLKTGEVWIKKFQENQVSWIVTDAFCGPKVTKKLYAEQPELLGTFPSYGIADRQVYFDWLTQQVRMASPNMIIPCHGSILSAEHLGTSTLKLIEALL
ncbi:hypothetical protein WH96_13465 [Kiloniella spongiae]|uniref:Metallo-beta-lactamase domain-containing protein n=2 Tax=Kiloniella spongiae TaxID=1489064 RepID=A0A0H2MCV4_9PROT|nr:hypothetical protein WH96_13465 [Kiloniella spongiae]